jgi:hypothetical protein
MHEFSITNARTHIVRIIFSFAVLAALMLEIPPVVAKGHKMKSDVTIYLDGTLLERGGTVFVVPREVPSELWVPQLEQPNPARSDSRLDQRKPITAQDRRLSVKISDIVSIVRFDYPIGGNFEFRFLPSLESGVPPEKQGSVLVGVGNTYDYHPVTDLELFVPTFQAFSILGADANEEGTRILITKLKLGYLEERYECESFENALACKAGASVK